MMRPRVHGVVFDLDGVLVHSTVCHDAAFKEVLLPFGITDFEYPHYAGWRTPEVFAAEFQRANLPAGPEIIRTAAERKTLLARRRMVETNPVASGCFEVLASLAGCYRLALASSGSKGSVHSFLDVNGCRRFFRSILTGDDIVHSKPDPEIYRKSFAALGLQPDDCVVVEDAVAGIEAARRAGSTAIGITGTHSAETLLEAGAAHVVDALTGLPDLLSAL